MQDANITIHELKKRVKEFVDERDWNQFHSPKNLSMAIATEAAELVELFMWCTTQESQKVLDTKRIDVEDEVADILLVLLAFVNAARIDLAVAFERKMKKTILKYPIKKVKGRSDKYTTYK